MLEREAEDLAKILSNKYGLPYLDASRITIGLDALKIVPEEEARSAGLAVFQAGGKKLQVAILSPNKEETKNLLKKLEQNGYRLSIYMVSETSLKRIWKRYAEVPEFSETKRGIVDVSPEKLSEFLEQAKKIEQLKNIFLTAVSSKRGKRISDFLEIILAGAIGLGASDIHLEPEEDNVRLRFRLDGVLHEVFSFEEKVYRLLLSRIKLISGLKLNVHDRAQDGRFTIHLKDSEIEIRVSVIPGAYGESIVARVLDPKSISVPLEDLGMEQYLYDILIKEIKKPNGMLLTTGPTGSGKTTTLYAFLKKIYSPNIKIITIEDPIEYHLSGITQTQVEKKKGYTFANGLRAVLRQDPDVIMIGEIRDLETAKTAMNSALTGHLVFSTLHTNNAAGTIPRLVDLGVNPNIIAPALNAAMAQRLVRKLCEKCKKETRPNEEEKRIIEKNLEDLPKTFAKPDINNISIWKPAGCEECNNIGYKGRIGIYEIILVDKKIESLILKGPSETQIWETAKEQGIPNMQQNGILKALKGITSLEELQRIVEL